MSPYVSKILLEPHRQDTKNNADLPLFSAQSQAGLHCENTHTGQRKGLSFSAVTKLTSHTPVGNLTAVSDDSARHDDTVCTVVSRFHCFRCVRDAGNANSVCFSKVESVLDVVTSKI